MISDFQGHKRAEENQSFTAAREPTNKINTSASYYATRSSPPVASRLLDCSVPSSPSSTPLPLCSLFPRHNDSLPPQPAGLPSRPRRLATPAGLTSVSTRKSKSGLPTRAVPLRTCATFIFRRRSVTVRRSHRKIRWPPVFHSHSHETLVSHRLLKNCVQQTGESRGE